MMRINYLLIGLMFPLLAHAGLLDDITSGKFKPAALPEMTKMADGEHYAMMTDEGDVFAYSYRTGKLTDTLYCAAEAKYEGKKEAMEGYMLSPSDRYMLVYNHSRRIFRHSFEADYYIYDRKRKELKPLTTELPVREPVFSPDGKYIAFARANNIYIHKLDFHSEVAVTKDGKTDTIYNGVSDWLYEEEFGITSQYCFSDDSKQLAFVRLDATDVPLYQWVEYLDADGKEMHYPEVKQLRYPKAGDKNPVATVCVYDTYYKSVQTINLPEQSDSYLPRIRWNHPTAACPTGMLLVERMNRDQDKMEVFACNPKTLLATPLYKEVSEKYWVDYELFDEWQVLSDNSMVVVSEKDGYRHAYLYSSQGIEKQQFTKGKYDVTKVYGYDEATGMLYYQAADKDPMTRYIYQLNVKKQKLIQLGTEAGMHSADFSVGYAYYVDAYQSVTTPVTYTLYDNTGKHIRVLKDNKAVAEAAKKAGLPTKEFFQMQTERGETLNGWMLRPAGFDENKQYPVLMMQYSGPESQQVLNRWRIDWEEYLAAQEGVLCVCVDGRGTGARGKAFRGETYCRLGEKEAEDQASVARWLSKQPYVDGKRIAIWGWSFGGFQSLRSMSVENSPFRCGIAVAPVTDWRLYDSAYTERFMRRPQVNESGYAATALSAMAEKLQGRALIVHGLADDNVHAQHLWLYTEALNRAGKQYELQVYPDDNHFLRKRSNYNHLYHRMLLFLKNNL